MVRGTTIWFQFLYGTIKIHQRTKAMKALGSFNSYMVRLKFKQASILHAHWLMFQFLYGTIKIPMFWYFSQIFNQFQFLYNRIIVVFQFLYGTIKIGKQKGTFEVL